MKTNERVVRMGNLLYREELDNHGRVLLRERFCASNTSDELSFRSYIANVAWGTLLAFPFFFLYMLTIGLIMALALKGIIFLFSLLRIGS